MNRDHRPRWGKPEESKRPLIPFGEKGWQCSSMGPKITNHEVAITQFAVNFLLTTRCINWIRKARWTHVSRTSYRTFVSLNAQQNIITFIIQSNEFLIRGNLEPLNWLVKSIAIRLNFCNQVTKGTVLSFKSSILLHKRIKYLCWP